jgi:hypothetical protein
VDVLHKKIPGRILVIPNDFSREESAFPSLWLHTSRDTRSLRTPTAYALGYVDAAAARLEDAFLQANSR